MNTHKKWRSGSKKNSVNICVNYHHHFVIFILFRRNMFVFVGTLERTDLCEEAIVLWTWYDLIDKLRASPISASNMFDSARVSFLVHEYFIPLLISYWFSVKISLKTFVLLVKFTLTWPVSFLLYVIRLNFTIVCKLLPQCLIILNTFFAFTLLVVTFRCSRYLYLFLGLGIFSSSEALVISK